VAGRARSDGAMTAGVRNPVLDQIAAHRSVRFFDASRPLPEGTLETLVRSAQRSSTSSNMQIWSVVVVADPQKRATLRSYCRDQAFVKEAPLFLLFCADTYRLREVAARQGYAFNYSRIDLLLAATIDAALACQNAALAAESMGLGCCMVGGVRNQARDVSALFELPRGVYGVVGLAVGYAKQANETKPRLPSEVVVHVDRYTTAHLADGVTEYDGVMAATGIYDGRRVAIDGVTPDPQSDIAHYGWAEHTARRLARGNARRKDLGPFLRDCGFVLE
jgi:FMN reductase [NAD(P)H]